MYIFFTLFFRRETLSTKTDSFPLSRHSYSSQNASSILPVSVHNRSSRFFSSTLPNDPYNIPSVLVHPAKALTDEVPSHLDRKAEDAQLKPHRSEQQRKEHDETMKQYDRLLERIRKTDEQLHSLSQSWTKSTHERIPVSNNYFSYDEIFRNYEKEFFQWLISGRNQSKSKSDIE